MTAMPLWTLPVLFALIAFAISGLQLELRRRRSRRLRSRLDWYTHYGYPRGVTSEHVRAAYVRHAPPAVRFHMALDSLGEAFRRIGGTA